MLPVNSGGIVLCHVKYGPLPAFYVCGQRQIVNAGRVHGGQEVILRFVEQKNAVACVLQGVGKQLGHRGVHAPADIGHLPFFTGVGDGREKIDAEQIGRASCRERVSCAG